MDCNGALHAGYPVTDDANVTSCYCSYSWWADPVGCTVHVTQQVPADWLTFGIVTTAITGPYAIILIWCMVHAFVAHLPPFEKACHLLMALWSTARTVWPWIPVSTDAGHFFFKWVDNIGGDLFLTYLLVINMMLISLALRKKIVQFAGIRGWYMGALVTLIVLLFAIEIVVTFLGYFLYLETILLVYLIYYLFALGSVAIFSFVSGGIIAHTLRSQAKELGNSKAGKKAGKIIIHMFIISVCSLSALPMLAYIMPPDETGFYPDMLIGGYLKYIVYIRVWEYVAALSFIARRGPKAFFRPCYVRPSQWSSEPSLSSRRSRHTGTTSMEAVSGRDD